MGGSLSFIALTITIASGFTSFKDQSVDALVLPASAMPAAELASVL